MDFLLDFFPAIIFLLAFKWQGIYIATASLIIATFVQLAITWFWKKTVKKMHVATALLVLVFGGLTIYLQNEWFIKWKPSIIYLLFAVAFAASGVLGEKLTFAQRILGAAATMPPASWQRLNLAWVLFFIMTAGLNLYVAHAFSTDTWVTFKVFGLMGLTILFLVGQVVYLYKAGFLVTEED